MRASRSRRRAAARAVAVTGVAVVATGVLLACAAPSPAARPVAEPVVTPAASSTASSTAPAPSARSAPVAARSTLRILLVDDDGWDAPGITAVRTALVAAGHDVTLVAPAENQSGAGIRSGDPAEPEDRGEGRYSVDGTPADATRAGLDLLRDRGGAPDLVVSGTNLGENSGTGIADSGTVGAAVTAVRDGVPAIAVSTHRGTSEEDTAPTAGYVARVVSALAAATPALAPGSVVNLNYPAGRTASEVRWREPAVVDVDEGDDGAGMRVEGDGPDDDRDLLDDGIATISELDVDGRDGTPPSARPRLEGIAP